jgi:hypothetical protein
MWVASTRLGGAEEDDLSITVPNTTGTACSGQMKMAIEITGNG